MFGAPLVCSRNLQVYISIHKRHLIFCRCDFKLKQADRSKCSELPGLVKTVQPWNYIEGKRKTIKPPLATCAKLWSVCYHFSTQKFSQVSNTKWPQIWDEQNNKIFLWQDASLTLLPLPSHLLLPFQLSDLICQQNPRLLGSRWWETKYMSGISSHLMPSATAMTLLGQCISLGDKTMHGDVLPHNQVG